ncbi:MAG: hypothetical protein M1834_002192 [Cirrosporium novae-zelandiae]|nr:MAG: hypothetical protein M1834_002192 [Cirrosporium novae-zelandiae]
MQRIAIAGTSGLAQLIAYYLSTTTNHQFFLLSRSPKPQIEQGTGYQIIPVNYSDQNDLQYQLTGVDVVLSTVSGPPQLNLIQAAAAVGVRKFAPSEFEGSHTQRPAGGLLDRGKSHNLNLLHQLKQTSGMEYCVFACGILYERFAQGGMVSSQIGFGCGAGNEGDYLMNIRNLTARIPYYTPAGQAVHICMTSANDLARFIVAAVNNLQHWPIELRMCGERMTTAEVVQVASMVRGQPFQVTSYSPESLQPELTYAQIAGDYRQQIRLHTLIATAQGRYDFQSPNANTMLPAIVPQRFSYWLQNIWPPLA